MPSLGPRLEKYNHDIELSRKFDSEKEKNELYCNLRAASQSIWDLSSRWIISKDGTQDGNIADTKVQNIIPVDLNAIMCGNFRILSEFYSLIGDNKSAHLANVSYKKMVFDIKNN